jgi:hypothetical protein
VARPPKRTGAAREQAAQAYDALIDRLFALDAAQPYFTAAGLDAPETAVQQEAALQEFNPHHEPAGSPKGGQFASGAGGGDGGVAITTQNIEDFRGALTIQPGDLPYGPWDIFDRAAFEQAPHPALLALDTLVSTKNQLLDPKFVAGQKADPRQNALARMTDAARGTLAKRPPITVRLGDAGTYRIEDGNATVQALMLAGWTHVPAQVLPGTAHHEAWDGETLEQDLLAEAADCLWRTLPGRGPICITAGHGDHARGTPPAANLSALFGRIGTADGGFTYDTATDQEPTDGFIVSTRPERSVPLTGEAITEKALLDYALANWDALHEPGNMFGAWHDPKTGTVWLDVVQRVDSAAEAEALALAHDQIAYFDIGRGASVDVNRAATSGQKKPAA